MTDIVQYELATVSDMESMNSSFNPGSLSNDDYITKKDVIDNSSNGFYFITGAKDKYQDNQLVRLSDVKWGLTRSVTLKLKLGALFYTSYPYIDNIYWNLTVYQTYTISNQNGVTDEGTWTRIGGIRRDGNNSTILYTSYIRSNVYPEPDPTGTELEFNPNQCIVLTFTCTGSNFQDENIYDYNLALGINEFHGTVVCETKNGSGEVISSEEISIDDEDFMPATDSTVYAGNYKLGKALLNVTKDVQLKSTYNGASGGRLKLSSLNIFNPYQFHSSGLLIEDARTSYVDEINRRGVFYIDDKSSFNLQFPSENPIRSKREAYNIGTLKVKTSSNYQDINIPVYLVLG